MALRVVDGGGVWDERPSVRVGSQAMVASELGSAPFVHSGRVWRFSEKASRNADGEVVLSFVQVDWPGIGDHPQRHLEPLTMTYQEPTLALSAEIRLPIGYRFEGHRPWEPRGIRSFTRVDESWHYPTCVECETLWPCKHAKATMSEASEEKHEAMMAAKLRCARCDRDLSGGCMSIRFGKPVPFDAHRLEEKAVPGGFRLREVTETFEPVTRVDNPVAFCGKKGACRNAAHRWADANGWVIPVSDRWTVTATKRTEPQ